VVSREPPPADADARSLIDHHLRTFHAPFRALVGATPEADMRLDDLRRRDPLSTWGQGPVTLLGDAAHPMLPHAGQGAAQALEDAVLLGHALQAPAQIAAGLRRYEAARLERTRAIVELSGRNARMCSLQRPLACWLRDALVQLVPERSLLKSMIAIGRPPELRALPASST
jgi:2-polyprenyl-6-methoxyphenol hydroxylase-like FAD-dependent oxidoreductase